MPPPNQPPYPPGQPDESPQTPQYPPPAPYPGQPQYPPPAPYPGQPQYPASQPYPGQPQYPPSAPYPGQPQYPGQPSAPYPGQPQYPASQPYPGQPNYPPSVPYPGQPQYAPPAPYPGQPQYPPSAPYTTPQAPYPGGPPQYPPSQPYTTPQYPPSQPYTAPGYGGEAPYAGQFPPSQPWPVQPQSGATVHMLPAAPLARPLPLWAVLLAVIVGLGALGGLAFTGADWAASGLNVGLGAGFLAVLLIVFTGIRAALGMAAAGNPKRTAQFVGAGLITFVLLAVTFLGFGLQNPLHKAQAASLESQAQYIQAIHELQLAGESAPNSAAIASVYNDWGEAYTVAKRYPEALTEFNTVLSTYPGASDQVTRAHTDIIAALLDQATAETQGGQYTQATADLDKVLGLAYCDSACQTQTKALDATAYFALGKQQLAANTCSTAATTYQTVVTRFPGTPEASQAATALATPQAVKGTFSLGFTLPTANIYYAVLIPQQNASASNAALEQAIRAATIKTRIAGAANSFSFTSVAPATYNMAITGADSTGIFVIVLLTDDTGAFYPAVGQPLCATDLGSIPAGNANLDLLYHS